MKNFSPAAMQIIMASAKVLALYPHAKVISFLPYEAKHNVLITAYLRIDDPLSTLKKRLEFKDLSEYKDALDFLKSTCHQNYDDTKHMWFVDIP